MEDTIYKMLYDAPIGKMIIVSNGVSLIEIDHVNHEELFTTAIQMSFANWRQNS